MSEAVEFLVDMPEFDRLTESSADIQFGFVKREATPRELMRPSIQLHLRVLSILDTVYERENLGVERARSTIHSWAQKADVQPTDAKSPGHVVVGDTVIRPSDQRYWLYAAVDPATNEFRHMRLFPTRNTAVTSVFLSELTEKHGIGDVVFLVYSAPWLHAELHRHGLRFRYGFRGDRIAVERIFQEVK